MTVHLGMDSGKTMSCNICGSTNFTDIFKHPKIPVYNVNYFATSEAAKQAEAVAVDYVQCQECKFLFNSAFQQLSYQVDYNVNRSNSAVYRDYLNGVVDFVVKSIEIDGVKSVVEVGAGDCSFAELLQDAIGDLNSYHAFDPSWPSSSLENGIVKTADYYLNSTLGPNLVLARHVLEHQQDVRGFIAVMSHESPDYLFIEIPCREFVLENNYHCFANEHCSYLGQDSLDLVMSQHGYCLVNSARVFNQEYIIAIYSKTRLKTFQSKQIQSETIGVENSSLTSDFQGWKSRLRHKINKNDLIWGANGKGVMMMNILGMDNSYIPFVCDKNPEISGKHIPVTGNKIISPSDLRNLDFGKVVVLNKLYKSEIMEELAAMSLNHDVVFIGDL